MWGGGVRHWSCWSSSCARFEPPLPLLAVQVLAMAADGAGRAEYGAEPLSEETSRELRSAALTLLTTMSRSPEVRASGGLNL